MSAVRLARRRVAACVETGATTTVPGKTWSAMRKRSYAHLKDSLLERGLKGRVALDKAPLQADSR